LKSEAETFCQQAPAVNKNEQYQLKRQGNHHRLQNLNDPSQLGAGMAVALLTTFYGALAANLVFIPLAGKLGIYSKAETTAMEMIVEGICAIAQGENPTAVREKMQAFVSQGRREEVKATIGSK